MTQQSGPTIHAVIFDLWGTLITDVPERGLHRRSARFQGVVRVLAEAGVSVSDEDVARAMAAIEPQIELVHADGRDVSASERLQLLVDALRPGLAADLHASVWPELIEAERDTILTHLPLVMEGAIDALEQARARGIRVGLVSNTGPTPGVVLREALDQLGLAKYFLASFWSDEVGWWKPAPEIYRLAADALEAAPERTVFIGDTPETDIAGALQAGMWAVQIGHREHADHAPHARISGHHEFWEAVDRLVPPR